MQPPLRSAGAVLRPRQHLRAGLPAHDRGVPAHDRGPDLLRGHRVRQPRGRRLRPPLLRCVRRVASPAGARTSRRAWAIAFQAAADRSMPASGNLSLGINAHVQRDLPFALAAIGLVKPDGSSRKPDHDRVNEFLNRVTDDLYAEIARRFDPTIDDSDLPGTADDAALFQIIPTLARDRLAQRRTTRQRELRRGARRSRRQHRGIRRLTGGDDPARLGLRTTAEQRGPRRLLQHPSRLTAPSPPGRTTTALDQQPKSPPGVGRRVLVSGRRLPPAPDRLCAVVSNVLSRRAARAARRPCRRSARPARGGRARRRRAHRAPTPQPPERVVRADRSGRAHGNRRRRQARDPRAGDRHHRWGTRIER